MRGSPDLINSFLAAHFLGNGRPLVAITEILLEKLFNRKGFFLVFIGDSDRTLPFEED